MFKIIAKLSINLVLCFNLNRCLTCITENGNKLSLRLRGDHLLLLRSFHRINMLVGLSFAFFAK